MKHRHHPIGSLALLLALALPTQAAEGLFNTPALTPETALSAAQATLKHCRAQGYQVGVAVVDRAGLPQVLLRDRYAGAHTVEVATRKAWTAASFKIATSALGQETQAGKEMSAIRDASLVLAAGGGLPIEAAGSLLGAIAVSGAPSGAADEACAKAGIEAIRDLIEF